jgi:hypothetical protein
LERPEGKVWEKGIKMTLFFEDEAPRIGVGWRPVWTRFGRKWAYLAGPGGYRARISKTTFDKIVEDSKTRAERSIRTQDSTTKTKRHNRRKIR